MSAKQKLAASMWRIDFRLCLIILTSFSLHCAAAENKLRVLSLDEAILLAVRENPNVERAQLNYVTQKFALELQQWQFQPHYLFNATQTTSRNYSITANGYVSQNSTGIDPSVSWNTP